MHRYELRRAALRSMRRIPPDQARKIFEALDELAASEDPRIHHNVKAMRGEWHGNHRLRIGNYRAIFTVQADPEIEGERGLQLLLISVINVGPRGGIYD